ncbi:glycoside hydrolase family 15 protein [Rhodoligotrophos defluvii]|uniref:glycoside hydrolase family 15 protein n=1 Tax=Rhodoligotrophos defluvii TaxID=2561934 RepID=UPI0019604E5B|nr:glycoside hydrolase family 15 protein [Rhodoligotrophos defluvii]
MMTLPEPISADRDALVSWMETACRFAVGEMLNSISATGITKERPGFGQTIVPKAGSVLASPVLASYDPDPDYFFHWLRDSAIVMDALRVLIADGVLPRQHLQHFAAFVDFSLALGQLDGRALPRERIEASTAPDDRKFLRPAEELAQLHGDRVLGDVRFNPDGTLDITRWERPQNDGPALRALTLLRYRPLLGAEHTALHQKLLDLLRTDLDYTCRHWRSPSVDFWEEEANDHYATRVVQLAALEDGTSAMQEIGAVALAQGCRTAASELRKALTDHWSPQHGFYLSRLEMRTEHSRRKARDIATILAVLHAERHTGPHSVLDPKVQATLVCLEDLFAAEYPINHGRNDRGPAMGRYLGDVYYSGGAYYFSTLAAAEFYYRLSAAVRAGRALAITPENRTFIARCLGGAASGAPLAEALLARGDQFMATVRDYTPASLELSEQFDQTTGVQTSAKRLTWSYAALITAVAARRRAQPDDHGQG